MKYYRLLPLLLSGVLFPKCTLAQRPVITDSSVLHAVVPASKEPRLSRKKLLSLLQQHVKYLFVLYQENRSFDSYFAAFPGADGLYNKPASRILGFRQPLENSAGQIFYVQPFRIGRKQYAADLGSVGHAHPLTLAKMHLVHGRPEMNRFAMAEEADHTWKNGKPTLKAMRYGELEMAHEDADTIPFLWRWANRFVLCDHIFEEMSADSTPGNLCIIAAQSGATQWALHPNEAFHGNGGSGPGVPVVNDSNPYWGSAADTAHTDKMPYNPKDYKKTARSPQKVQRNLTFATLMLTLTGRTLPQAVRTDNAPGTDLRDVQQDIKAIAAKEKNAFSWGWYEEGYGEPVNPRSDPKDADGLHISYVTHHNGPQYFGYIANNPAMASHLHGLSAFFSAVKAHALPGPGVYYVKGGKKNIAGLKPLNPALHGTGRFEGDDDHPGDSDSQISEALLARTVNAIARSPYWKQCAIVITWDDCEGDYDHVPPPQINTGPDGKPLSLGPRIPLLLISPYARAHAIMHSTGCTASVVRLADHLFSLIPLAKLPDELHGRQLGQQQFHSKNIGPLDALTPGITGLLGCFDPARLSGRAEPLPASWAEIPDALVRSLKKQNALGWQWAGIEPLDLQMHIAEPLPPQFTPRPNQ